MFLLECFLACELTDAASTAVPNSSKSHFFFLCSASHLSEQEGEGSKGKGPAVLIGKIGLTALRPVQHFIIYTGNVQHQAHHQSQT